MRKLASLATIATTEPIPEADRLDAVTLEGKDCASSPTGTNSGPAPSPSSCATTGFCKDLPNNPDAAFMDDTENPNGEDTERERAADTAAENALIPSEVWNSGKIQALLNTGNSSLVKAVASEFGISPAVLAGRLRWKTQKYVFFQDLLGKCRSQLMPAAEEVE